MKPLFNMNLEELTAEKLRLANLTLKPEANNHDASRYSMIETLLNSLRLAKFNANSYLQSLTQPSTPRWYDSGPG